MESHFSNDTVQSLIELGRQTAGPQMAPGANVPFVIVNGTVKPLPELIFNEHAERPERIKAAVKVFEAESFCGYWKDFSDADSRSFADESALSVIGVLDYHESEAELDTPRWCQHRVTLTLRQSEQWKVWTAHNNLQKSQQEFIEFLEQNGMDIIVPAPAAISEMAHDLEAHTDAEWGSSLKMQNGSARLKFSEQTTAKTGNGSVDVPDGFKIGIPVFIGGQPQPMDALLRFRCREGKLTFWYTLVRPEAVIRAAFIAERDAIAATLGITIINGVPA